MKSKWFLILFSLLLFFCKDNQTPMQTAKDTKTNLLEKKEEIKIKAVALFVVGDVKINDKNIKATQEIQLEETIKLGAKSICDIQLVGLESKIVIRLKSNSEFRLGMKEIQGIKNTQATLLKGNAIFQIKKMPNSENFITVTPTSTVGVRGTKYEIDLSKDGSSRTIVLEGKVAVRTRVQELESLPNSAIEKSKNIQAVTAYLSSTEVLVETGKVASVSKKQTEDLLAAIGFLKIVKNTTSEKLADEFDKLIAVDALKSKLDMNKKPTEISIREISKKELDEKLKEYEELLELEKEQIKEPQTIEKSLKENPKQQKLLVRIEAIMGKKSEILILKNGTKLEGVIQQAGNTYIVLTIDGKKEFRAEEVEGIEFK